MTTTSYHYTQLPQNIIQSIATHQEKVVTEIQPEKHKNFHTASSKLLLPNHTQLLSLSWITKFKLIFPQPSKQINISTIHQASTTTS